MLNNALEYSHQIMKIRQILTIYLDVIIQLKYFAQLERFCDKILIHTPRCFDMFFFHINNFKKTQT